MDELTYTDEQLHLIRNHSCREASDDEFLLFMHQVRRTSLDPLSRQIYGVMRWNKSQGRRALSIEIAIDGSRVIAERSGKYAGQVGPFWCDDTGQWKDAWLDKSPPIAAKVGILRNDFAEPCWGVARYDAYKQTDREGNVRGLWATMPEVMTAKCAEAQALRKTFPQVLSGLYTSDEMDQEGRDEDNTDDQAPTRNTTNPTATKPQPNPSTSSVATNEVDIDKDTGEIKEKSQGSQHSNTQRSHTSQKCNDCDGVIKHVKPRGMPMIPSVMVAKRTEAEYGVPLCLECAAIRAAATVAPAVNEGNPPTNEVPPYTDADMPNDEG